MKNNIVTIIIVAVVFAGIGFFAGTKYQQSKSPQISQLQRRSGNTPNGVANRQNGGFQPISGNIINSDSESVTVKLGDGSSKIVFIDNSTTINKSSEGTKDDLQTDTKVAIFGSQNEDGSISASSIQINPSIRPENQVNN